MEHGLATEEIRDFLNELSQHFTQPVKIYLLGGSALCFLGNPRRTIDIDCIVDIKSKDFESMIAKVARDLQLEVEIVPIHEFIPLPAETEKRHQIIGKYGNIEVYVFDPYSIALSKLARGFDTDVQDILFLLQQEIIELNLLAEFVENTLQVAWDFDIERA